MGHNNLTHTSVRVGISGPIYPKFFGWFDPSRPNPNRTQPDPIFVRILPPLRHLTLIFSVNIPYLAGEGLE